MTEATFMIDSYRRNTTFKDNKAMIYQIYNLIVMDPGTDSLNPEKGVGILSYKYAYDEQTVLIELENDIRNQVSNYTPYTLTNIICKSMKNKQNKSILHIFISLNELNEVINISTDGERTSLSTMQA